MTAAEHSIQDFDTVPSLNIADAQQAANVSRKDFKALDQQVGAVGRPGHLDIGFMTGLDP